MLPWYGKNLTWKLKFLFILVEEVCCICFLLHFFLYLGGALNSYKIHYVITQKPLLHFSDGLSQSHKFYEGLCQFFKFWYFLNEFSF